MRITKYAQSAILLEYKSKRILIDPGKYCYSNQFTPDNWGKIDILLITHEHQDHCLPEAIKIILQNNPEINIITNKSVQLILSQEGIRAEILGVGETKEIDGIQIKGIKSIHGDLPNGKPKPEVLGFLIDEKIYHPGDTIYMEDKPKSSVVFVPICGVVVMNPEEAARFATETGAKLAIPVHYDNPDYPVDVIEFKEKAGGKAIILNNTQSVRLED
jgi:L-ascorbate metabolism protein UlaG (beta-lactamase superfamily)